MYWGIAIKFQTEKVAGTILPRLIPGLSDLWFLTFGVSTFSSLWTQFVQLGMLFWNTGVSEFQKKTVEIENSIDLHLKTGHRFTFQIFIHPVWHHFCWMDLNLHNQRQKIVKRFCSKAKPKPWLWAWWGWFLCCPLSMTPNSHNFSFKLRAADSKVLKGY